MATSDGEKSVRIAHRHRSGLVTKTEAIALVAELEGLRAEKAGRARGPYTYRDHAEALYEALNREFDGFEDDELLLCTVEALDAYKRFKAEQEANGEALLIATAPVNVTACPTCGGAGPVTS